KEQFKLNKKEIKLLPFLKEKVEAFRIKYQTEEIKINEEYKFNTISIELDEFQITTAINNLLNNAVKYSDNSAEVSIFCYIDKELVIEISDKGIGLNAEQQKQIFDKFYRANTGNIHNVKGLGLGLYYVKKIIEAHKGRIEVISKVGKGSTFTIYLPL
ncbi:sensor histidine kinase, partial [Bacteroidota bacterium]